MKLHSCHWYVWIKYWKKYNQWFLGLNATLCWIQMAKCRDWVMTTIFIQQCEKRKLVTDCYVMVDVKRVGWLEMGDWKCQSSNKLQCANALLYYYIFVWLDCRLELLSLFHCPIALYGDATEIQNPDLLFKLVIVIITTTTRRKYVVCIYIYIYFFF